MADSDVIELLNGQRAVYGDSDIDDNFLDENGLPTDTFLDAVKAELEGYENRRRHELQREEMRKAESWKLEAKQMLEHKSEDRKKENQYFNRGLYRPPQDSEISDDDSYDLGSSNVYEDESDLENLSVSINASGTRKKSHTEKTKIQKKTTQPSRRKSDSEIKRSSYDMGFHAEKVVKRGTDKKRTVPMLTSTYMTKSTTALPSRTRVVSTRQSGNIDHLLRRSIREIQPSQSPTSVAVDGDTNGLENETKIKSLQLRVKGQLQTIKNLEDKLGITVAQLEDHKNLLAAAQKKLSAIERKERMQFKGLSKEEHQKTVAQVEDQLLRMRQQYESAHAKFIEEQEKRVKSDERCRSMREHVDRQKSALSDLQNAYTELQKGNSDTQAKFNRLKKDARESTAENLAMKDSLLKSETELAKYKQKVHEYEYAARNLKLELEASRDDARKKRHDLFSAQDRIRHLQLELDVIKERSTTRKMERKFRGPENDSDVDRSFDSDLPIRNAQRSDSKPAEKINTRVFKRDSPVSSGIADHGKGSSSISPASSLVKAAVMKAANSTATSSVFRSPPRVQDADDDQTPSFVSRNRPPLGRQHHGSSYNSYNSDIASLPIPPASSTSSSPSRQQGKQEASSGASGQFGRLQKMYERVSRSRSPSVKSDNTDR